MSDRESCFGNQIIFSGIKKNGKVQVGGRDIAEMKKEEGKISRVITK